MQQMTVLPGSVSGLPGLPERRILAAARPRWRFVDQEQFASGCISGSTPWRACRLPPDRNPKRISHFVAISCWPPSATPVRVQSSKAQASDGVPGGPRLHGPHYVGGLRQQLRVPWREVGCCLHALDVERPLLRPVVGAQSALPAIGGVHGVSARGHGACRCEGPDSRCMELEARSNAFIDTIVRKIQAQKHLVKRYLDGDTPVTAL